MLARRNLGPCVGSRSPLRHHFRGHGPERYWRREEAELGRDGPVVISGSCRHQVPLTAGKMPASTELAVRTCSALRPSSMPSSPTGSTAAS